MGAAMAQHIDVVIVGSNLDEEPLRGIEVLRELNASRPEIRAVILLDSSKREVVLEAFRAGARGLFSRHDSLDNLSKCVRQVYEGQTWASSQQVGFAIEALASAPTVRAVAANGLDLLSKREMDVVRCLAEGLSNREIAQRLGLSQHTIKNYLFRVFDRLGVSSRLELMSLTLTTPQAASARPSGYRNGESLAWCLREAQRGDLTAQITLAEMYAQGKGIARDLAAAYVWCLVAERTNDGLAEKISTAKTLLEQALTPEQLLGAQKLATEQLKKSPHAASVEVAAASGTAS
jgi:DNA-binding NarL/FixJ family response regulator